MTLHRAQFLRLFVSLAIGTSFATDGSAQTQSADAGSQLRDACTSERSAALSLTKGDVATFPYLTDAKVRDVTELSAESAIRSKSRSERDSAHWYRTVRWRRQWNQRGKRRPVTCICVAQRRPDWPVCGSVSWPTRHNMPEAG